MPKFTFNLVVFIVWFLSFSSQNLYAQQPTIISFAPSSGPVGTIVTITGTNFSIIPADNIVYFGSVKATVTTATISSLVVKVPVGAAYKPITVTTNSLTAYSIVPFVVTFAVTDTLSFETSFESPIYYKTPLECLYFAIGDFDSDGKPDVVCSNSDNGSIDSSTISVFRNTGSPHSISFAAKKNFPTGVNPRNLAEADFDGDGKLDIVVYNQASSTVSVFRNTSVIGNISFAPKVDFTIYGQSGDGISVNDVDGDGRPDIVTAGTKVSVLRNTTVGPNISFATAVGYEVPNDECVGIVLADFDGDGKPDIATTNYFDTSISVFANKSSVGTIAFGSAAMYKVGLLPYSIHASDLDGDGKPDVVVANGNSKSISVLRNISATGSISFAEELVYSHLNEPLLLNTSDLTGDGKPDIVCGNFGGISAAFFRNTSGAGSISFATNLNDTGRLSRIGGVAMGDFDGDGKDDLVLGYGTGSFSMNVFRNKSGEALPLTLLDFSGKLAGKSVQLQWHTANELNTSFFDVERSTNGNGFASIGTVNAVGRSNGITNYSFIDGSIPQGTAFYRLKMVDANGAFTYSKIISFSVAGAPGVLTIYPNPATYYVLAQYPPVKAQLIIADMGGKVVKTVTLPGNNSETNVDIKGLATGTYIIRWSDGKTSESKLLFVK